jgi:uncharacterized protein (DUF1499 family)
VRVALVVLITIIVAGLAYVRLAPSDPLRWNVDAAPPNDLPEGAVVAGEGGARAVLRLARITPEEVLARLDRIALETPRTRRLAGTPAAGRMTWITRSAVFGLPDYTTASARPEGAGTVLTLHARLRFGRGDLGVNAARLRRWVARLAP